jgi:DNA-binding IclR family transcriptional regulator
MTQTFSRTSARAAVDRPVGGRSADTATSVGKALSILNAFLGAPQSVLGVSEIARRAGVAKSTAHRLLLTLGSHGLVERVADGWRTGPHLFRLGNTVPVCRPRNFRDQALPYMQDLFMSTMTMVNLAVPHENQALIVEQQLTHKDIRTPAFVGGCLPMYCTAIGKAMLAHLPGHVFDAVVANGLRARTTRTVTDAEALAAELDRVRRTGYAMDLQETKVGLICVAAPILAGGKVIGALSLSLETGAVSEYHVKRLQQAAASMSAALPDPLPEVELAHTAGRVA